VNSLFKISTNSLEQEVIKKQSKAFCLSSKGVFASHFPTILVDIKTRHTRAKSLLTLESYLKFLYK